MGKLGDWLVALKNEVVAIRTALNGKMGVSGGTFTGSVSFPSNQYYYNGHYAVDAHNSDFINMNALWFSDTSTSSEGLLFKRSNSKYDGLRCLDGNVYVDTDGTPGTVSFATYAVPRQLVATLAINKTVTITIPTDKPAQALVSMTGTAGNVTADGLWWLRSNGTGNAFKTDIVAPTATSITVAISGNTMTISSTSSATFEVCVTTLNSNYAGFSVAVS